MKLWPKKKKSQSSKNSKETTDITSTEKSTSYKLSRSVPSHASLALNTHKVLSAFTLPRLSTLLLIALVNMLVSCVCGRDVNKLAIFSSYFLLKRVMLI